MRTIVDKFLLAMLVLRRREYLSINVEQMAVKIKEARRLVTVIGGQQHSSVKNSV